MSVDYQPWYVGQTKESWNIPLLKGGVADDISSVTVTNFTMTFHPTQGNDFVGTGTFTANGTSNVFYKPSPSDVAGTFNGTIYVSAYWPPSNSNLDETVWDGIPFVISPK